MLILWVKWGFWAITLVPDMLEGQARALSTREIISFSKNVWAKILAHCIGVQGPSKLVKKTKTPHFASLPQANPSPKSKHFFFNRTKKTCRIRRGFEQLSSYRGWQVITKKLAPIYWLARSLKGNIAISSVARGKRIRTGCLHVLQ